MCVGAAQWMHVSLRLVVLSVPMGERETHFYGKKMGRWERERDSLFALYVYSTWHIASCTSHTWLSHGMLRYNI